MSSSIIDYDILRAENHTALANQVNAKRAEGWQPYEGLFIINYPDGSVQFLYQAIAKYWPPLDDFEPNKGKASEAK